MKVLILHQHFNTPAQGGAIRSYYLAKALLDHGLGVVVITGHNDVHYKTDNYEGIEIHYVPAPYNNNFGFYKRIFSFIQYFAKSLRVARTLKDVNFCYAISVPLTTGLAGIIIGRRLKVPFIFEVGDLWPDAPIQLGFINNPLLKQLLWSMEKTIYRNASAIVALSPSIASAVRKKAPGPPIHLIPNFSDTDFYRPEEKKTTLIEKFGVSNKFVVSYIGAVGFANGLDFFLECARASKKAELPVHFLIVGEGAMRERLQQTAASLQISNVSFIPLQNRNGVQEVMNVTDAAFICYRPFSILETGSPNKYFDGLAAGKLIFINFGGWIKEEIEKEKCGAYIDPKNPRSFVDVITAFIQDPKTTEKYRENARSLALRKYDRQILSHTYASIFKNFKSS